MRKSMEAMGKKLEESEFARAAAEKKYETLKRLVEEKLKEECETLKRLMEDR